MFRSHTYENGQGIFRYILLPLITRTINHSFTFAIVTPILKKDSLIAELLKNFRKISNLTFLSEVLEKGAAKQLLQHKDTDQLRGKIQNAYREIHSTKTALLWIQHDLLISFVKKQCVFMVMLEFSAAFDTVNHQKLLDNLYTTYGIGGNAHDHLYTTYGIRGNAHEWKSSI